ncbi:MAG TPA: glutathione S-transferase family protein [Candidatus Acidoferrum sp.]|nr:glutathione S-transferase family protein [Candidatus Acidoferrum sp.]
MILFGISVSPFARKVLIYAAERGIALENRPLSPHADDAAFRAASPTGKIPALQDGDYTLADSSAIVQYLEAKFPANTLIPAEARARGKVAWFDEYADTVMFPVGTVIFFNRVVMPKLRRQQGDLKAADDAEANKLPLLLAYLESCAPAQGFLVGDALTLADITIVTQLINLEHGGVPVDAARYPKLAAYYARIAARPAFRALIDSERKLFGMS